LHDPVVSRFILPFVHIFTSLAPSNSAIGLFQDFIFYGGELNLPMVRHMSTKFSVSFRMHITLFILRCQEFTVLIKI
jgi:hypothetical protein